MKLHPLNRKIISVVSGKGGTGKTTLATNLVAASKLFYNQKLLHYDIDSISYYIQRHQNKDLINDLTMLSLESIAGKYLQKAGTEYREKTEDGKIIIEKIIVDTFRSLKNYQDLAEVREQHTALLRYLTQEYQLVIKSLPGTKESWRFIDPQDSILLVLEPSDFSHYDAFGFTLNLIEKGIINKQKPLYVIANKIPEKLAIEQFKNKKEVNNYLLTRFINSLKTAIPDKKIALTELDNQEDLDIKLIPLWHLPYDTSISEDQNNIFILNDNNRDLTAYKVFRALAKQFFSNQTNEI